MTFESELHFRAFFRDAKWLWSYLPICPYTQFESPSTGIRLLVAKVLFWIVLASLVMIFLGELWFIWELFGSDRPAKMATLTPAFAWLILSVIAFEMTLMVYWDGPKIMRLLRSMDDLFPRPADSITREQFRHWNFILANYNRLYCGTLLFTTISPVVRPALTYLVTGRWRFELIFYIRYPFDEYAVPWVVIAYVWEVWVLLGTTLILSTVVVLVGAMTMQICLQNKLMAHEFRELLFVACNHQHDRLRLVQLMVKHNKLIKIGQEMHVVYSFTLFVNYLLSSMVICLFCFSIATAFDPSTSLSMCMQNITFVIYSSLFSYFGQLLIDNSSILAGAIYDCNWYEADIRLRRLLIVILLRASKPEILTGMGFFVIGMQSQGKILTTSYSYFTLLRNNLQ